jgi:hypothetical protein
MLALLLALLLAQPSALPLVPQSARLLVHLLALPSAPQSAPQSVLLSEPSWVMPWVLP